ncbi:long-chain fatty acid--CoA ligase [Kitasatospora purpeofusca]|uniref:class I adenylate-forming enzyme family protein n=1 Tax=Kitasatospora purpeofusca TaxID=67352 RepID=UPI0033C44F6B
MEDKLIGSFVKDMASYGDADAIVFSGTTYSYRDLLGLVEDWQSFLRANKVEPGEVIALESAYSPASCAAMLALIEIGAIIVPLTTLPAAKRQEFHEVGQVEVVITVTDAGREFERTGRSADHQLYQELPGAGLVLFSSGTTGRSKASVLDFQRLLARYDNGNGQKRPRRTLAFLSLDHIGGINTLFHTFSQGGAVITVPERTPVAVFAAVEEHRVSILPTTPTFLTMVLISGALDRHDTSSLELITYGTEPMPTRTLSRMVEMLPEVRFKQTYGLSELGILPTKSRSDDTLWVKLGSSGFEHKIIDNVLWIRSEMAMLGYLNAPAPFDADGFFNTQDVVEVDGDWVCILGRQSEIINVGGEKVYPSEVESVVLEISNIADATVSGRANRVTGMVVSVVVKLVEPEDIASVRRRIREHCSQRLEAFKVPASISISSDDQHSDRFKKLRNNT